MQTVGAQGFAGPTVYFLCFGAWPDRRGAAGSRGAARGHRVYEGPKGESKGGSGKRAGGFQAGGVNTSARTMGVAENRGCLSSFSGLEF